MSNQKATSNKRALSRKQCYGPADFDAEHPEHMEDPGVYPYTRGIYPAMYRDRLWTIRQYAGFGTAEESNERYRYLLSKGNRGLSVAFDLPTQMGLDSDHPMARGEVGRVGVAIDSLEDLDVLFKEIPLGSVSTSMTINATAVILFAFYLALAEKRKTPWDQLRGTLQNDILKEYIARGTYVFPPLPSLRLVTDVLRFCTDKVPNWNTISISGYHIREAGANAVQEVAFTLANARAYVQAALQQGLEIDSFAPRLSFFFSCHNDFFEEVAKFRAARQIWAKLMREEFGAADVRSWKMRFHTQTAGSTLAAQQPSNNAIRVTLQALAAVLGGTQSLHANSMDEALALPTEESAQLAVRTQQIIAHETGVREVSDPLGGAWYIESLTADIASKIQTYLERIGNQGGALKAIENGFFQKEIQTEAYEYQKDQETGKAVTVGVNRWAGDENYRIETMQIDRSTESKQNRRLKTVREKRDTEVVNECLRKIRAAARLNENLVPPIIEAAHACATVGEITEVLKSVFGEHRETTTV